MTPEEIAELERLCAEATPGPWYFGPQWLLSQLDEALSDPPRTAGGTD